MGPKARIIFHAHTIHVWYIYLHLVDFCGKCRQIYHNYMDLVGYYDSDWAKFHRDQTAGWSPQMCFF